VENIASEQTALPADSKRLYNSLELRPDRLFFRGCRRRWEEMTVHRKSAGLLFPCDGILCT